MCEFKIHSTSCGISYIGYVNGMNMIVFCIIYTNHSTEICMPINKILKVATALLFLRFVLLRFSWVGVIHIFIKYIKTFIVPMALASSVLMFSLLTENFTVTLIALNVVISFVLQ